MRLCAAYDGVADMSSAERNNLYAEMLLYDEIKSYALEDVAALVARLTAERNASEFYALKRVLNDVAAFDLRVFSPKGKTFYENAQNVHAVSEGTIDAAVRLIRDYGTNQYDRPEELADKSDYFSELERMTFDAFDPKLLFIAVYSRANEHPDRTELLVRLSEEMDASLGLCATGFVARLVNVLAGYDDRYAVTMNAYEAIKTRVFHQLTRTINPCDDDYMDQIARAVNSNRVAIPAEFAIRILEAYTGEKWERTDKYEWLLKSIS